MTFAQGLGRQLAAFPCFAGHVVSHRWGNSSYESRGYVLSSVCRVPCAARPESRRQPQSAFAWLCMWRCTRQACGCTLTPARPPPMGVPGRPWRVWLCCAGIHVRRVAKDVSTPLGPLTWKPVRPVPGWFPAAAHRCAAITNPPGLLWTIPVDCAKPLDRFHSKPGRPVPGWFPCPPAARPRAAIAKPPGLVWTMPPSTSALPWANHGCSKPLPPDSPAMQGAPPLPSRPVLSLIHI